MKNEAVQIKAAHRSSLALQGTQSRRLHAPADQKSASRWANLDTAARRFSLPLNLSSEMVRTRSTASHSFRAKSGTRWNASLPSSGAQGAPRLSGGLSPRPSRATSSWEKEKPQGAARGYSRFGFNMPANVLT